MSETKPMTHLLGNRVAISSEWMPETNVKALAEVNEKEGSIILSPDEQKKVDAEKTEKLIENSDRFKIVQVGDDCNEKLKAGQEVMIEKAVNTLRGAEPIVKDGVIVAHVIPERAIAGIF